jgi:hypothetical protein
MKALNYFGVVLMCTGGLLSLWTMRELVRRRALLRDPVKVNGMVIRVRHVRPTNADSVGTSRPEQYFATVRFETEDGQSIERELPPTRDWRECQIGALVRLVYQRCNPANVVYADMRWADLRKSAIGSLIFLGIGALLCFCLDAR